MEHGWLNVMSLIFGLIAWALPLVAIGFYKTNRKTAGAGCNFTSWVLGIQVPLLQIVYHNNLVRMNDWTALADVGNEAQVMVTIFVSVLCGIQGISLSYALRSRS